MNLWICGKNNVHLKTMFTKHEQMNANGLAMVISCTIQYQLQRTIHFYRAMAKKITINEKLLGKIRMVFSHKLSLNNIEEFEEMEGRKLFEDRPEHWTQIENVLCEYTNRIQTEIMNDIKDLLENGWAMFYIYCCSTLILDMKKDKWKYRLIEFVMFDICGIRFYNFGAERMEHLTKIG